MRKHSNLEAFISECELKVEETAIKAAKIIEENELLVLFIRILYFTDREISDFRAATPGVDTIIPFEKDFMSYVIKHASEIKKTLAWGQVCKLNFQYKCLVLKNYLETKNSKHIETINWINARKQVDMLTLRELFKAKIES